MSETGQKAKCSLRADVFRFGPHNGHRWHSGHAERRRTGIITTRFDKLAVNYLAVVERGNAFAP